MRKSIHDATSSEESAQNQVILQLSSESFTILWLHYGAMHNVIIIVKDSLESGSNSALLSLMLSLMLSSFYGHA